MIAIGTVTAYWIVSRFYKETFTTVDVNCRASRISVSRMLIAPFPGDFLLASRSSSQS